MNLYEMLKPQEKAFHNALQSVVNQFGPYDQEGSGVWVGYVSAQNNTDSSIGVKCLNCSFYQGEGKCSLLSYLVEEEAICRLAAIPDELVNKNMGKSVSHWNDYGKNDAVDFHTETAKKGMDLMNDDCLSKAGPCWEGYVMRGMKPGKNGKPVPNCVPATTKAYQGCGCPECLAEDITCEQCDLCNPSVAKADNSYTPNAGMKSAARRALKWKEDGKATGAGTAVGWGRASDIVAGRSMSLETVKRMYSFFSRHEVDKKGKDFYNTSNPSNGRIMWDAWGGDAGFSWSRKIVQSAEANKIWQGSAFSSK